MRKEGKEESMRKKRKEKMLQCGRIYDNTIQIYVSNSCKE